MTPEERDRLGAEFAEILAREKAAARQEGVAEERKKWQGAVAAVRERIRMGYVVSPDNYDVGCLLRGAESALNGVDNYVRDPGSGTPPAEPDTPSPPHSEEVPDEDRPA